MRKKADNDYLVSITVTMTIILLVAIIVAVQMEERIDTQSVSVMKN